MKTSYAKWIMKENKSKSQVLLSHELCIQS